MWMDLITIKNMLLSEILILLDDWTIIRVQSMKPFLMMILLWEVLVLEGDMKILQAILIPKKVSIHE